MESFRKLSGVVLILTINAAVFVAFWWFWPRLAWPTRRPAHPGTGPYPSAPNVRISLLVWSPVILLIAIILLLISPPIAVILATTLGGMLLLLTGIRRRVGCGERCRCGYPVSTPRWSRGPCPECGPRAVILGQDRRSTPRIAIGLLLLAAAAAAAVALF
jgi:hypothetical protein